MPQPYDDVDWLDAQYNNRRRVPAHGAIFERWHRASALARQESPAALLDLRYGDGDGETLDVFPAAAPDAPLLVFVHGGYWRSLDKAIFSWL